MTIWKRKMDGVPARKPGKVGTRDNGHTTNYIKLPERNVQCA